MRLKTLLLNGGSEADGDKGGEGGATAAPETVAKDVHDAAMRELEALRTQTADLAAAIKRSEAKATEDARKARESAGDILPLYEEAKGKLTAAEERAAKAEERAAALEKQETDRLAGIARSNKARAKELPDDLRAIVDGLPTDMRADLVADQIARVEAVAASRDDKIAVGSRVAGKPAPSKGVPPECQAEAEKRGEDPEWYHENVWKLKQARKKTAA